MNSPGELCKVCWGYVAWGYMTEHLQWHRTLTNLPLSDSAEKMETPAG